MITVRWSAAITAAALVWFAAACAKSPQTRQEAFVKAGEQLMANQDYPRAALEFRNAVQLAPKDAALRYKLADALLAAKLYAQGAAELRLALELDPKHAGAQLRLAHLLLATGDPALTGEAAARSRELLTLDPADQEALMLAGLTEVRLGNLNQAARFYGDAAIRYPHELRPQIELARVKFAAGDYPAAEAVLLKAVSTLPANPDALVALAVLYISRNKPDAAQPLLQRALVADPNHEAALMQTAGLHVAAGRLADAGEHYRRAAASPGSELRLVYGEFLARTGKADEAAAEFRRLSQRDPSDRRARNALVLLLAQTGQRTQARQLLDAALARNAKDALARVDRARLNIEDGNIEAGIEDLQTALKGDPAQAEAHFLLAVAFREQGAVERHRAELAEALRHDPAHLLARVDLANSLTESGQGAAAVSLLSEAPDAQRKLLRLRTAEIWALLATGDRTRASAALEAALRMAKTPDLYLQDAILKQSAGNTAAAKISLEAGLVLDPQDLRLLGALIRTMARAGDKAGATARLRRAAEAAPQSVPVRLFEAHWLMQQGDEAGARAALQAVRQANPNVEAALLMQARQESVAGRPEQSRSLLTTAIAGNPKSVSAWIQLALLEENLGNKVEAARAYREALKLDARNLVALNNLAYNQAENGDLDEALRLAQQARGVAPDHPNVQDTLGWVYFRKGMYKLALPEFQAAAARNPRAQYHLGMTQIKLGDAQAGNEILAAALKQHPGLTPESEMAKKILADAQ